MLIAPSPIRPHVSEGERVAALYPRQFAHAERRPGQNEEEPPSWAAQLLCETGGDLLSQAQSNQVPSAQLDLTSVFGMGTGVTPALSPPRLLHQITRDLRPAEPMSEPKRAVCDLCIRSYAVFNPSRGFHSEHEH